jgi:hypothetical protein
MSERVSLLRSAGSISLATAMSRVLGLMREQVQSYYFGAGLVTDAFLAAFRIPNLLRDLFAEGALSSAFVPTFTAVKEREGEDAAQPGGRKSGRASETDYGFEVRRGDHVGPLCQRRANLPPQPECQVAGVEQNQCARRRAGNPAGPLSDLKKQVRGVPHAGSGGRSRAPIVAFQALDGNRHGSPARPLQRDQLPLNGDRFLHCFTASG